MKFTIETSILHAALGVASVAVDSRLSLPILGNVKLQADENGVSVTTTNLDLFVEQTLPSKGVKPGTITVPFDLLHRLTGRLTTTKTEIELSGKSLKIRCGEVNAVLETLPGDEFPPTPTQKGGTPITCGAKELLLPLQKVNHAICDDSSRYQLCGVNINGPEFVATDGKRLAIFVGTEFSKESVIIPTIFVKSFLKIAPAGEITVMVAGGLIAIESDTLRIVCKLVEAQYPNWKAFVPGKPGKEIFGCDRQELIEALKTCSVFRDGMMNALTISGRGKEIEVAKDEKIKAMVLGSELAGQPKLTKRFNANYLLDALGVLEDKNVAIHCDKDSPTLIIQEGAFKTIIQGMIAQ